MNSDSEHKSKLLGLACVFAILIVVATIWVRLPREQTTIWYEDLLKEVAVEREKLSPMRDDLDQNAYLSSYLQNLREKRKEDKIVRAWIAASRDSESDQYVEALQAFQSLSLQRKETFSKPVYLSPQAEGPIDLNTPLTAVRAELAALRHLLEREEPDMVIEGVLNILRLVRALETEPRLLNLSGGSQCRLELLHALGSADISSSWDPSDLERLTALLASHLSPPEKFQVAAAAEWNAVEKGVRNGYQGLSVSWIWKFPGALSRELRIARNTHIELLARARSNNYSPPSWLVEPTPTDLFSGRCGVVTAVSAASLDGPLELWSRARATQWGLAVSYSLAQYHHQHGRYPKSLEELVSQNAYRTLLEDPAMKRATYKVDGKTAELSISLPLKLPDDWGAVYDGAPASWFQQEGKLLKFRLPDPTA